MPPSSSTATARCTCRGCGCSGSMGWMGVFRLTSPMLAAPGSSSKKNAALQRRQSGRRPPLPLPAPLTDPAALSFAAALGQVAQLVQHGLLRLEGRFLRHPLALLDQLADLLAALMADLRVELGTARGTDGLAALLADLLVELMPTLGLDRLAALAADLLVERPAPLLGHLHSAPAPGFCNGHPALLLVCHFLPPVVGRNPPPLRLRPLLVSQRRIRGCASCLAR